MHSFSKYITLQESKYLKRVDSIVEHLDTMDNALFITTSNRWEGHKDLPKSHQLAAYIAAKTKATVTTIDASKLNIYQCEGNVSTSSGNNCGVKASALKDSKKNPSGCHRCWASINNKDDELWKISKPLLEANAVIFFGSVRWGSMNAVYQKLIERLTWLENRHSTLNESNIIKGVHAGVVAIGQNWNGTNAVEIQKQVLKFYGFNTSHDVLFWNWQYTNDKFDESQKSYKDAAHEFTKNVISQ